MGVMVSLKHAFVSAKADGGDSTLVKPSAWDAEHNFVTATDGVILGRSAGAGAGAVQELPMSSVVQPGTVSVFAGSVIPAGYLLCDGSLLNRADQPALFTAIGTAFNIGGEATTQFRIPDCRGRIIAMLDGGTGRLPGYTAPGAAGGAASVGGLGVNVTVPQIGVAVSGPLSGSVVSNAPTDSFQTGGGGSHTVCAAFSAGALEVQVSGSLGGQTNGAVTASGGTTAGFGIVQPTIAMNMMIKT
jgi:microcystin-dependent protein